MAVGWRWLSTEAAGDGVGEKRRRLRGLDVTACWDLSRSISAICAAVRNLLATYICVAECIRPRSFIQ